MPTLCCWQVKSRYKRRATTNCNEMANIFVFGNYAAVAANMPNREFRAANVVSEKSKTFR